MFTDSKEETIHVHSGQASSLTALYTRVHMHVVTGSRGLPHIVQVVDAGNHFD